MIGKRLKNLKLMNKSINAATILPLIKQYTHKLTKSRHDENKKSENNSSEIIVFKIAKIHSHEIAFCRGDSLNLNLNCVKLDKSKKQIKLIKNSPKISVSSQRKFENQVECNINLRKSMPPFEQKQIIFSNIELISKINKTDNSNDNNAVIMPSRTGKVIDLYKLTKNKIKHESGNIFHQPFLLDRLSNFKQSVVLN